MATKILVVEDDPINLDYILIVLKSQKNITLSSAITGEGAIEKFKKENPKIILLDIRLPDIDGVTVMKKIKKESPETIIIAQTAHALQTDEKLIMESGFDDFIAKPMRPATIINIVNKYL